MPDTAAIKELKDGLIELAQVPPAWKKQIALLAAICSVGSIGASAAVHYGINQANYATTDKKMDEALLCASFDRKGRKDDEIHFGPG